MFDKILKLSFLKKKTNPKLIEKIEVIKNSNFFDGDWYLMQNLDVAKKGVLPEYHYFTIGWREGRNPSHQFINNIYFKYNPDVRKSNICPLYHFEKFGKFEDRKFTEDKEIEKLVVYTEEEYNDFKIRRENAIQEKISKANDIIIEPKRIVFKTFQSEYTCNPKYICEEIIKQKKDWELIWITSNMKNVEIRFPKEVKVIKEGTKEAFNAIHSAKLIIDNGVYVFSDLRLKKEGQISLETWHGSLGFKKLLNDNMKEERINKARTLYGMGNDYVLINSEFEKNVFRESYWQETELKNFGHPRNDIFINKENEEKQKIKKKVYENLEISLDKKVCLYAPTFRENEKDNKDEFGGGEIYNLDFQMLKTILKEKFTGDWEIIVKHHFINKTNKCITNDCVDATLYPDIQELMIVSDFAITDYSSWILDFMLTRKPAFLFAVDYDKYSQDRGFCYPLKTSPFPIAKNNEEMKELIINFDYSNYIKAIEDFLVEKGCNEDGLASKRTVEFIEKLLES